MVQYICKICLKEFKQKIDYARHINRKYKCKEINISNLSRAKTSTIVPKTGTNTIEIEINNTCTFCNRKYKRKSELNRHLKNCKIKIDSELKEELLTLLIKENDKNEEAKQTQIEQQNLYLKHKIDLLQGQLKIKNKTINSHNNINSNHHNQTINILAYNKTDLSHITDKDFERIMRRCNMCIPHLIEKAHYDPNKPENKNIFISNIKDRYVMKWNGKKWNLNNREEALEDLYENGSNTLEDRIETWEYNKFQYDQIAVQKFYKFLDNKDKDEVKNKIKEEIKLILYNNRLKINN